MILDVEYPVVQAGMGGGMAGAALAAPVAEAGGLGQIGFVASEALRAELAEARRLTSRPVAINVIVPLARRAHWAIAADADAVVTHWESNPRRRTPNVWIHTVGTAEEAGRAVAAGADGVIAQGVESGGHVRGTVPALDLLERVRSAVPADYPVLLAGGIATAADVSVALDAGAVGAVAGTRFLASPDSGAHPEYKQRLLDGNETILTELFGLGWPNAPHRVLPNEATRRWLGAGDRGPATVRTLHRALGPITRMTPLTLQAKLAARPRAGRLDLTAAMPHAGMDAATIETHPLYAGQTVGRITDLRSAAQLVRDLTP